jgi:hypothetical protein
MHMHVWLIKWVAWSIVNLLPRRLDSSVSFCFIPIDCIPTLDYITFREFNLFVLPKPLVRFISNWSNTIPALSIPFCWRRRCARDLALDADLFLEIPAFVRFDVKADIIPLFCLGRGRDFSDLSTSKEGEDSRRAAREWTDLANYRMKVNGALCYYILSDSKNLPLFFSFMVLAISQPSDYSKDNIIVFPILA